MAVYILHFDPPYLHARHYVGFSEDVPGRFDTHSRGRGSPLVKAALRSGSTVTVAHVWEEGDRTFERKIKNAKSTPRFCPICKNSKGGHHAHYTGQDRA